MVMHGQFVGEVYPPPSIPKTKVIKQPAQQTNKTSANNAARTANKSITPQKPLSNQQIS